MFVEVCASKKSPECSLELGMFVWSMLGEMGEEIALHRSSVKMLIFKVCHFSNRNHRDFFCDKKTMKTVERLTLNSFAA